MCLSISAKITEMMRNPKKKIIYRSKSPAGTCNCIICLNYDKVIISVRFYISSQFRPTVTFQ